MGLRQLRGLQVCLRPGADDEPVRPAGRRVRRPLGCRLPGQRGRAPRRSESVRLGLRRPMARVSLSLEGFHDGVLGGRQLRPLDGWCARSATRRTQHAGSERRAGGPLWSRAGTEHQPRSGPSPIAVVGKNPRVGYEPRMVSEPGAPRTTRWVPLALVALALLLRLRGLITFPLEQDELYTVQEATQLFRTTLKPGISGRPLYYLLEHVLLAAGPATPLLMRLPPLLFGLAGVWATWRLGARLFGVTAGWVAVLVAGYAVLRLTGQVGALRNFQGRGLLATLRLLPAMVQWTTPTVCAAGGMGALLLLALRERPAWRRFGAMALVGIASTTVLLF